MRAIFEQIALEKPLPFALQLTDVLEKNEKPALVFFELNPSGSVHHDTRDLKTLRDLSQWNIVLICSSKDDYLELARQYKIGNIILNHALNPHVIRAVIARLLGEEFFGFKPFFPNAYSLFYKEYLFCGSYPLASFPREYFMEFAQTLPEEEKYYFFTNINEMIINAFCFGVYGIKAEERDHYQTTIPWIIRIPTEKAIRVVIAQDEEKYGISITDQSGSLTLERVLEKIHRHTPLEERTVPKGMMDVSGHGLFMISRQSRLIINILKNIRTEVIVLRYSDPALNNYQSLIINEKNPAP